MTQRRFLLSIATRMLPNKLADEIGPMMRVLCLHGFRQTAGGGNAFPKQKKNSREIPQVTRPTSFAALIDTLYSTALRSYRRCL